MRQAFVEQLTDLAARIVDGLALRHRNTAIGRVVLQQRGARGIDLDFQRYVQFAAVIEHGPVRAGQAGGAEILIVALLPLDGLGRAIDEFDHRSLAPGPVAAAGARARLQHGHLITQLSQFVSRDQPSNPGAEDNHLRAFANSRRCRNGAGPLPLHRHQTEGLHGCEGRRIPTGLADSH